MNIYKLMNADSEDVEKALNAILGTTPRQGGDKAPSQSGEIQPFEKKVVVTRYERSNALLVLASPQDYKLIREIIAQLDVPQRQVLIEAVIMKVGIQNNFELAVNAAGITGKDGLVVGDTSYLSQITNLASGLTAGLTSGLTSAATTTSATKATTAITPSPTMVGLGIASTMLGFGKDGGITAAYRDTMKIGGVKYPFVPLLIKCLETLTNTDILSQPSLTTQDNESADMVVGQEIPVPSARSGYSVQNPNLPANQQVLNNSMSSYGRGINRQDVGVKMKIKPHINEGDYVSVEAEIEVSEVAGKIDPNSDLGPTLDKTKVTNIVVVKDGETGVIAGLIAANATHGRSQTPVLGDLPLLGRLFRNRNDAQRKTNLVILITPYIIKEGVDLDRITKYKMNEFQETNADILFDKGFIKKIKRGREMRETFHPSVTRSEKMLEKQNFGRTDIER